MTEIEEVARRYERRRDSRCDVSYLPLLPDVYLTMQEKERAIIHWIKWAKMVPVSDLRLLEVGCGSGRNLLDFIRLGFQPGNLVGIELLEDRASAAREHLPAATRILMGDAAELEVDEGPFDIALQSTVFTSLLDNAFQHKLADRMWTLTKPGGGVLWYDFVYDNPKNPDVRGIPIRKIGALFPEGRMRYWRLTLAPPIARRVCRVHPHAYHIFNIIPWLRTHVLCWIGKRGVG